MGHFFRDFAPHAVGLNKIDSRKKARLTEKVRPGIRDLGFQFTEASAERKLFELRSTFGKQNQVQRIVRPVRNRNLDWNHSDLS